MANRGYENKKNLWIKISLSRKKNCQVKGNFKIDPQVKEKKC